MYKSPKMKKLGFKTTYGDIYSPSLHRLHITLRALAGVKSPLGPQKYIHQVNDDLKRILRLKASKSATAKKLAQWALDAYKPILDEMLTHFTEVRPTEDYFTYMQHHGINWGRIRSKNKKRSRYTYTMLGAHFKATKEEKKQLIAKLQKVYTYTGQLFAAFDITSYPNFFSFVSDPDMEDLRTIVAEGDAMHMDNVANVFRAVSEHLNCRSTEDLMLSLGKPYLVASSRYARTTNFFS